MANDGRRCNSTFVHESGLACARQPLCRFPRRHPYVTQSGFAAVGTQPEGAVKSDLRRRDAPCFSARPYCCQRNCERDDPARSSTERTAALGTSRAGGRRRQVGRRRSRGGRMWRASRSERSGVGRAGLSRRPAWPPGTPARTGGKRRRKCGSARAVLHGAGTPLRTPGRRPRRPEASAQDPLIGTRPPRCQGAGR
jgi:hypothetical protein